VVNANDREPVFYAELKPLDHSPISFCVSDFEGLGKNGRITLRDVGPGRYTLTLVDGQGPRSRDHAIVHSRDIDVTPDTRILRVSLGAGCIAGQVQSTGQRRHSIRVIAHNLEAGRRFDAICDPGGGFCVRYLPPGNYRLHAHADDLGWCDMGQVRVERAAVDAGVHKLVPGAIVRGALTVPTTAMDDKGNTIRAYGISSTSTEYQIGGLWPGPWTLKLMSGDRVLAQAHVKLAGTATVNCDLIAR
jgi:hypothetical protein